MSELGKDRVNCLSTVSRNTLSNPSKLVDEYFNLGMDAIFLRPLSPYGFALVKNDKIGYTAEEYFEFYNKALSEIIKKNEDRIFIEETLLIHLRKIFRSGSEHHVDLQSPSGYVFWERY